MSEHLTAEAEKSVHGNAIPTQRNGVEQRPSFRWRDLTATKPGSPIFTWIVVACLPGLLLGLGAFISAVGPLEKKFLDLEARGVARDIDSLVQVRIAAVKIAAAGIEIDDLSEAGALDNLLTSFRSAFQDFLSLEVLNEHGEVLAMVGELPLSEARRFSGTEQSAITGNAKLGDSEVFLDDPKTNCFFITAQHESQDGTRWFSRTRYGRDPIEKILTQEGNQWTAQLERIPGGDGKAADRKSAGTGFFENWFGNSDLAEAPLSTSGWIVTLDKASKRTFLSKIPIALVVMIVLAAVLACLYRKLTSNRSPEQPNALAEWVSVNFRERSNAGQVPIHSGGAHVQPRAVNRPSESVMSEEEDYDSWTPRNVPMGFQESEEPAEQEPAATAEPYCSDNESADGSVSHDEESIGLTTRDDIPETLELEWSEPQSIGQTPVEAGVNTAPEDPPQAQTRMLSVPERMEVAWSEPAQNETEASEDHGKHIPPSTFHSA
jgi:hypothetical protein